MTPLDIPHAYKDGDTRRDQIVSAARSILAESGVAGLRTRAVADRAGINVSTLHFHVKGKAALLLLVAERTADSFLSRLPKHDFESGHAKAMLRDEIAAFRHGLEEHSDEGKAFFELSNMPDQSAALHGVLEGFKANWRDRFVAILEKGRGDGSFRPSLDPLPGALIISSTLVAFARVAPSQLEMFGWVTEELERSFWA